MSRVHDGEAVRESRMLSSHRTALGVLRHRVLARCASEITWLDIGCGNGQVLHGIEGVVGASCVRNIHYVGCDGCARYCEEAERFAREQGLHEPVIHWLRIETLWEHLQGMRADFVSIINVTHELDPPTLAATLCDALCCVSDTGLLHVHDVRFLDRPELGSVCWDTSEVETVLDPLLTLFEWGEVERRVQQWGAEEAPDWSLNLDRALLLIDQDELVERRDEIVGNVRRAVEEALPQKRSVHDRALRAFLEEPAVTEKDRQVAAQAVYEHWTIGTWLEVE